MQTGYPPWAMKLAVTGIAALALVSSGIGLGAVQQEETTGARATVTLVSLAPPAVRGAHFKNRERVRVTFVSGATRAVRTVRSGRGGGFTVALASDVVLDRCGDLLLVSAVGARGSRASLKRPLPDCPPSLTPPP